MRGWAFGGEANMVYDADKAVLTQVVETGGTVADWQVGEG